MGLLQSTGGMLRLLAVLLHASVQLMIQRPRTRAARALWLHQLCRRAVQVFAVDVRTSGKFPEAGVLVSNHLSYLDIVVFASIHPCVFVSKAEIRTWPLIGWMTTMSGTVYVERGRGGSARRAGAEMRVAAEDGLPVLFFPEGTTSNGDTVLKFHSGLLSEARSAQQPITAAFIRYALTEDNRGQTVRDSVAYWGDQAMLPHVFGFFALRGVRAEVAFADAPIQFAEGAGSRKPLAIETRQAVCLLSEEHSAQTEELEAVP